MFKILSINSFRYRLTFALLLIIFFTIDVRAQISQTVAFDTITLENESIRVLLIKDRPSIIQFQLRPGNSALPGNIRNSKPGISFYKGSETVMNNRTEISYAVTKTISQAIYHAFVRYQDQPAVEFDLTYTLKKNSVAIKFSDVVEHTDFKLLNILLPGLVSASADDGQGKLVIPADAGRLIDIGKASIKSYEYEIDWLNPTLAGFAYNSDLIGIMDTKSIENHSIASVTERDSQRYGSLSMRIPYRLNIYDLAEFGTVIQARESNYFLKVQDSSSVTISIAGDYDHDGNVSWVDGTKVMRDKISAVPNPYYQDKTFIRTFLDRKGSTDEEITFDEVLQRIKDFAAQTDSAAAVMYLLGWQYSGHDTGYPSVAKVNENLGGYDKLVNLITEARKYNVNVTFYDNYDDSYPNHPGWDPEVICMDPQGNLMRGGAWDGEQSFLISSYKYAVKSGLDRVRFTLDHYPVKKAYFIDVLAGGYNGGRKYDFNPESPAGAIKNFEGKLMILNEFNKQGIDVATEDFTGYFVGHAGTFGDIIAFDNIYFKGEEQIPMIPFIYHGKTSFGMKISSQSFYVRTFLYGQRAQVFTNKRLVYTPDDYILDALPKQKLYGESMNSYKKSGDTEVVTYKDGSMVSVNVKTDQYMVTLGNGQVIAKDYTSFVPVGDNGILSCSRDTTRINIKIPGSWKNEKEIGVYRILDDGRLAKTEFSLEDRVLKFNSYAKIPYKVIYTGR